MKHELKTWPEYFKAVAERAKTFEVRKNDRGFQIGDTLILKEWEYVANSAVSPGERVGEYTGREIEAVVTYVLKVRPEHAGIIGIDSDMAVMSIHVYRQNF